MTTPRDQDDLEAVTSPIDEQGVFRLVAAVIRHPDGSHLLVRKAGTKAFMNCGGKIEAGEHPEQALRREVHEETGLEVGERCLTPLGRHVAPAANEPGMLIDVDLFEFELEDKDLVSAKAEIAEVRWVDSQSALNDLVLAPLAERVLRGEIG
jgi:8-oxo-dGTP pyrophosphatase MutT (NUDIX family)